MAAKKTLRIKYRANQTQGLSSYRVIYMLLYLLIRRNRQWFDEIKNGAVSEDAFLEVYKDVWSWVYEEEVSDFDPSALPYTPKAILDDLKKSDFAKLTDSEGDLPANIDRAIKNNPTSVAVYVGLGLAFYPRGVGKIKELKSSTEIAASGIEVEYYPDFLSTVTLPFQNLASVLYKYRKYDSLFLTIAGNEKEFDWANSTVALGSFSNTTAKKESSMKAPLNQILFGPPGTGKTYETAYEAVRIIDGQLPKLEQKELHKFVMERFEVLRKERRIGFITFHPSYSYEEFIEGIFPKVDDANSGVQYERRAGVFKSFVDEIKTKAAAANFSGVDANSKVWRISLGKRGETAIFDYSMKNNLILTGYESDQDFEKIDCGEYFRINKSAPGGTILRQFVDGMKINDVVCVFDSSKTIRAIGIVKGDYKHIKNETEYNHTRQVQWIDKRVHDISEVNGGRLLTTQSLHRMPSARVDEVLKLASNNSQPDYSKPYVFIIDEINRANISKVFGELITLIEEHKRDGSESPLSSTLPYSKERFSIPPNLFLIGTMNTADKSIATLDMALRRRFVFREMLPNSQLVPAEIHGIPLRKIFERINLIISAFVGNDYCIGHSFLMAHRISGISDLKSIWFTEIIPLLNEYFHEDWEKLKGIVDPFIDNTAVQIAGLDERLSHRWINEKITESKFKELLLKLAA